MAGMFFTLEEAIEKLGKTKEQLQELIDAGNLREFWDGSKQLFKVSDVEELAETLKPPADEDGAAGMPPIDEAVESEETFDIETLDAAMEETGTPLEDAGDIFADEELVSSEPEEFEEAIANDGLDALAGSEDEDFFDIAEEPDEAQEPVEEVNVLAGGEDEDFLDIAEEPAEPQETIEEEALISTDDDLDLLSADETETESDAVEDVTEEEPGSILPEESLELIMPDETSAEAAKSEEPEEELEAIKPEDSIEFLLADETGLTPAVNSEEESLLSDETLSGLLGNENEKKQGLSDDLKDIGKDVSIGELTSADTAIGTTGINVLAESEGEFDLIGDSKSETQVSESEDFDLELDAGDESTGLGDLDLDADINLDSIGSGSGLLDLSLQADDTSLGAVLDDILPAGDDLAEITPDSIEGASAVEESEKIFEEAEPQAIMPAGPGPALAARYIEPEPTGVDNAYGITMLIPFLMLIFTSIIVFLCLPNQTKKPAILTTVSGLVGGIAMVWWIGIGLVVLLLAVIGIASMTGGSSGTGTAKSKKPKKAKKEKKPKTPKKPKNKKGKK